MFHLHILADNWTIKPTITIVSMAIELTFSPRFPKGKTCQQRVACLGRDFIAACGNMRARYISHHMHHIIWYDIHNLQKPDQHLSVHKKFPSIYIYTSKKKQQDLNRSMRQARFLTMIQVFRCWMSTWKRCKWEKVDLFKRPTAGCNIQFMVSAVIIHRHILQPCNPRSSCLAKGKRSGSRCLSACAVLCHAPPHHESWGKAVNTTKLGEAFPPPNWWKKLHLTKHSSQSIHWFLSPGKPCLFLKLQATPK